LIINNFANNNLSYLKDSIKKKLIFYAYNNPN
jgi:hypothetical protein